MKKQKMEAKAATNQGGLADNSDKFLESAALDQESTKVTQN